jgi:hypothetical protein
VDSLPGGIGFPQLVHVTRDNFSDITDTSLPFILLDFLISAMLGNAFWASKKLSCVAMKIANTDLPSIDFCNEFLIGSEYDVALVPSDCK